MMNLLRDIRYSARSLWKAKAFTIAVIVTLGLCLGANTAVLSVFHSLVLKPLPFKDADQIVQVFNVLQSSSPAGSVSSFAQYHDFDEHADLFEGFAISSPVTKVAQGQPSKGSAVSSDFFSLMKVKPLLGRFFTPEEVLPGTGNVVVLTQTAWENDFAADPEVVGREIRFLNEASYSIVGVAPRSMEVFDSRVRFFIPVRVGNKALSPAESRFGRADLWARLRPNVSLEAARRQLVSLERQWYADNTDARRLANYDSIPRPIELGRPNPYLKPLVLLQAGALLVLMVGCVNVVNLLLIRADSRRHELSVRYSFGATRSILTRLMLSESLLLASAGGMVGLGLAQSSLLIVNRYLAVLVPKAMPIALDTNVFVVTLTMVAGLVVIMVFMPFAKLWRSGHIQNVDTGTRSASVGKQTRTLSAALVVSQVAITFALLIASGLLFRSFRNVLHVDPGFDAARIVKGTVDLTLLANDTNLDPSRLLQRSVNMSGFASRQQANKWVAIQVRDRIVDSIKEVPGVETAAFESSEAVGDNLGTVRVAIRGTVSENMEDAPRIVFKTVSSDFFETMGIPIVEGREFHLGEEGRGQPTQASYIIDTAFVEQHLKGQPAVGAEVLCFEGPPKRVAVWPQVVGVAKRANFQGLESRDGLAVVYRCNDQIVSRSFNVLVRTSRPLESVTGDIQAKLREVDPRLHFYGATCLESPFRDLHLDREGMTLVSGFFACLALLLSIIGIYGVMAYDVQQREREFGIRSALGAGPDRLLAMVLRQGLTKAGFGLAFGLAAAFYLTQFLRSQLFDVTALDPLTYAGAISFVLLVALAASYLPARRAVRVDPMETLRTE